MGKPPLSGGGSGFELGGDRFCTWILYMDPIESVGLLLNRAANHEPGRFDGAETVPGLGQDAYWSPSFSGLDVLTGPYNLHVSVDSESRNEKDAAVAIARLALSRLR